MFQRLKRLIAQPAVWVFWGIKALFFKWLAGFILFVTITIIGRADCFDRANCFFGGILREAVLDYLTHMIRDSRLAVGWRTLHKLALAFLHIARENFKVLFALGSRESRRFRALCRQLLSWARVRKLAIVVYGLVGVFVLKAVLVGTQLLGFSIAYPGVSLGIDVVLLILTGCFFYLAGVVVVSLLQMERQNDAGLLQDGVNFRDLLTLRNAIETSPEAFALWDKNHNMVLSNARFREIFKLHEIGPDHAPSYQQFGAQVSKLMMRPRRPTRSFQQTSYQAQLRNGRWLNIQERATSNGGHLCVSFDVTNLKTVQQNLLIREKQMCSTVEDLRLSRRELEQKTQKLAELADKLMLEKERAEDANRVKAEFLANISHELRTPLNAIIGFSDMMQREVLGEIGHEKYKHYVNDIHMSGAYLLQLINDILDMSRIEAGRLKLDCKPCSLNQLLNECLNIIAPQALKAEIQLTSRLDDEIACKLDQRAIKQVVLNLMSNAIKFTDQGGEVQLEAHQGPSSISIIVQDNGIGISQSQISQLGKPFAQLENQMTKTHPGTGLGLAISRSLIDLHGGKLTIESEIGEGTRVEVCLPLNAPHNDQSKSGLDVAA